MKQKDRANQGSLRFVREDVFAETLFVIRIAGVDLAFANCVQSLAPSATSVPDDSAQIHTLHPEIQLKRKKAYFRTTKHCSCVFL
eukprot:622514-Rhodomonas_salina.1